MSFATLDQDFCQRCNSSYHEDQRALRTCALCLKDICCYKTTSDGKHYCGNKCFQKISEEEILITKYERLEKMLEAALEPEFQDDFFNAIEEIKEMTLGSYSTSIKVLEQPNESDCKTY